MNTHNRTKERMVKQRAVVGGKFVAVGFRETNDPRASRMPGTQVGLDLMTRPRYYRSNLAATCFAINSTEAIL